MVKFSQVNKQLLGVIFQLFQRNSSDYVHFLFSASHDLPSFSLHSISSIILKNELIISSTEIFKNHTSFDITVPFQVLVFQYFIPFLYAHKEFLLLSVRGLDT